MSIYFLNYTLYLYYCNSRFLGSLDAICAGKLGVTIILDDPAGNSYVQSLSDDAELDKQLKIERYERSFEQNEEMGLNDMKTDNYLPNL